MRVDLVRWTVSNINHASIRLPARQPRRSYKSIVDIRNPAIMLGFVLVLRRSRRGIPMLPELFDKAIAIGIGLELHEVSALPIGDDVGDLFREPFFVKR